MWVAAKLGVDLSEYDPVFAREALESAEANLLAG